MLRKAWNPGEHADWSHQGSLTCQLCGHTIHLLPGPSGLWMQGSYLLHPLPPMHIAEDYTKFLGLTENFINWSLMNQSESFFAANFVFNLCHLLGALKSSFFHSPHAQLRQELPDHVNSSGFLINVGMLKEKGKQAVCFLNASQVRGGRRGRGTRSVE